MKRLCALALMSLLTLGCSSDPSDPDGGGGNSTMSARVEGANWSAATIAASWVATQFGVTGIAANGDRITLGAIVSGPGTFDLTENDAVATYGSGSSTWYSIVSGGSGTLTITSISASGASGTFSFVSAGLEGGAPGTRTITQGTFNVKFVVSG